MSAVYVPVCLPLKHDIHPLSPFSFSSGAHPRLSHPLPITSNRHLSFSPSLPFRFVELWSFWISRVALSSVLWQSAKARKAVLIFWHLCGLSITSRVGGSVKGLDWWLDVHVNDWFGISAQWETASARLAGTYCIRFFFSITTISHGNSLLATSIADVRETRAIAGQTTIIAVASTLLI